MSNITLQGKYDYRNKEDANKIKRHHHYHTRSIYPEFLVICTVSNALRYSSRYVLYRQFLQHMYESGAQVYTIEIQQGDRDFQVTEPNNKYHLQLRTKEIIWLKENSFNLGINRISTLFPEVKYFAFIDADIEFSRKDWIEETLNQMQIYDWTQMFQTAIDLGPDGEAISTSQGFMYSYLNNIPWRDKKGYGNHWHPGYAHCVRKQALSDVGLWIDQAILGSADFHTCTALIGQVQKSLQPGYSKDYADTMYTWQVRAEEHIKRNVGYVKGNILHGWHGSKISRGYNERWKILVDTQFSPYKHLSRSLNGLYQINTRELELRDKIRKYVASRNEDSIDLK